MSSRKRFTKIKNKLSRLFKRPLKTQITTTQPCLDGPTFDVLVSTFPFLLCRKDIVSLMLTCRSFYIAGIPTLLSNGTIVLRSCYSIASFCAFMFRDGDLPARAYALRRLQLLSPACRADHCRSGPTSSETYETVAIVDAMSLHLETGFPEMYLGRHTFLSRFLLKILKHASRLEYLEVQYAEDWLRANGQIMTITSGLRSLRAVDLKVQTSGERTAEFIRQLGETPVSSMTLGIGPSCDTTSLLNELPETLTDLALHDDTTATTPPDKPLPSIRVLWLSGRQPLDASSLVRTFPNLTELRCEDAFPDTGLDPSDIRLLNQSVFFRTPWRQLELLDGTSTTLYTLGNVGQVSKVIMDGFTDVNLAMFYEVVNEAKPRCLSYATITDLLSLNANFTGLETRAVEKITEFHIQLWDTINFLRFDLKYSGLFTFLSFLPSLTHLSMAFSVAPRFYPPSRSTTTSSRTSLSSASSESSHSPSRPYPEAVIQRIASRCHRSVQFIAYQVPGTEPTHWFVEWGNRNGFSDDREGEDESPKVKKMTDREAEGVIWQLPMQRF